ncbi:kin of IRRE-like protein 2 [Haemaphysalis longicornis]
MWTTSDRPLASRDTTPPRTAKPDPVTYRSRRVNTCNDQTSPLATPTSAFSGLDAQVQEFEATPSDAEVNLGSETRLPCRVSSRRGECVWLKNGSVVGKVPDKYDFDREPKDGDCSLLVRNATFGEDDCLWQCQVTRASLHDVPLCSKVINLAIREKPHRPHLDETMHSPGAGRSFKTKAADLPSFQCKSQKQNLATTSPLEIDGQQLSALANGANWANDFKRRSRRAPPVLGYVYVKGLMVPFKALAAQTQQFEKVPSDTTAKVTSDVRLECQVVEGQEYSFQCLSRGGKPAAQLHWHLGGQNLTALAKQTDAASNVKSGTFEASSVLNYTFTRADSNQELRCLAYHPAYDNDPSGNPGHSDTYVVIGLNSLPDIRYEGDLPGDFVEGESVTLRCVATGSPTPVITWRKSGQASNYNYGPNITFTAITPGDAGMYSCVAGNTFGQSKTVEVTVNVLEKPKIIKVEPPSPVLLNVSGDITLQCVARGKPMPNVSWQQQDGHDRNVWKPIGNGATVLMPNVSYSLQTAYRCEASSFLKGKTYHEHSKEVRIDVQGPPQMFESRNTQEATVKDEVVISISFYSDPKAVEAVWSWDSSRLKAGDKLGRFLAQPIAAVQGIEDGYACRLRIEKVELNDTRTFTLSVDNGWGRASSSVALKVKSMNEEPETTILISVIAAAAIILLLFGLALLCFLGYKACVRGHDDHASADGEQGGHNARSQNALITATHGATSASNEDPQPYAAGEPGAKSDVAFAGTSKGAPDNMQLPIACKEE